VTEITVPLKNLEYWILAQLGLEVVLVLLIVLFLVKIRAISRRLRDAEAKQDQGNEISPRSVELAALEQKRGVLGEAATHLEGKAPTLDGEFRSHLRGEGVCSPSAQRSRGGSLRSRVEELHLQGYSAGEISQFLNLQPAEVKMALDLSRLKAERP
jgi:hypothetical protein